MRRLSFLSIVVIVLTLLLGACSKGTETSTTDDEAKPAKSKKTHEAPASSEPSAPSTKSAPEAKSGDVAPALASDGSGIPGIRPGANIQCFDFGRLPQFHIEAVGTHDWVRVTGNREVEKGLGGAYWMQLGGGACQYVTIVR